MNHSKFYSVRAALLLAATSFVFTACDSDDDEENLVPDISDTVDVAYFLSEGSWGQNNSALTMVVNDTSLYTDVYYAANAHSLGDTGQDLLYADGSLYATISESRYMLQMDASGVETGRITFSSTLSSPRYMLQQGDYIYVSLYGGYVGKVNRADFSLVDTCAVESYPEQMALVGGRLVVCNSGYSYGNTLSVIDLERFEVERTLTVDYNPTRIVTGANGKGYYITTSYDPITWAAVVTLHELDPNDWSSRTVQTFAGDVHMALASSALYVVESATTDYTNYVTTFGSVDYTTGQYSATSFLHDDALTADLAGKNVYMLAVNPQNGNIYIATSNYQVNSSLYIVSSDGVLKRKFADAGGINMSSAAFNTQNVD